MTTMLSRMRLLIAAAMLISCLALVACGGDDDKDSADKSDETTAAEEPTTSEEAPADETATEEAPADEGGDFAEQGNAICAQAQTDIQAIIEADENDVAGAVARTQEMVTQLSELTPPEDQQETFDALITGAEAQNTEAMRIVEDGGTAEDIGALDDSELDALATELGLDTCAA